MDRLSWRFKTIVVGRDSVEPKSCSGRRAASEKRCSRHGCRYSLKFMAKTYLAQPLVFEPLFMERVWGGRRLESLFGKSFPSAAPIGGAWGGVGRAGTPRRA